MREPTVDAVPISVLESWLYEIEFNNWNNYLADACEELISRLGGLQRYYREKFCTEQMPKVDAVPVRHGHWGNYEPDLDGYRCSCCKLLHRTCTTYCPYCGAKMDEEETKCPLKIRHGLKE